MMIWYPSTLLGRERIAHDTIAVRMTKPNGYEYTPSQAALLALGRTSDCPSCRLSLVSAPHERELVIATRLTGSVFKQMLAHLAPGSALLVGEPEGGFTHAESNEPIVLIAGGIGITPFMSLLRHRRHVGWPGPVSLLHVNRRSVDAPYRDEMQALVERCTGFHCRFHFTAPAERDRPGTSFGAAVMASTFTAPPASRYLLAGPSGFVDTAADWLSVGGIAENTIERDAFGDYGRMTRRASA